MPDCRTSPVADMQRSGRVGAYIFDQHSTAGSYIGVTIPVPLLFNFTENFLPESRLDCQVQEPGSDDFYPIKKLLALRKVFRDDLRDYARDILLDPAALARGYFRESAVRQLLDEHTSGQRNHGQRIWTLLTFEWWHRLFIDPAAPTAP